VRNLRSDFSARLGSLLCGRFYFRSHHSKTPHSVEEIVGTGRIVGCLADRAVSVARASDTNGHEGTGGTVALALKAVAEMIRKTRLLTASMLNASRKLSERTRRIDDAMERLFRATSIQGDMMKIADLRAASFASPTDDPEL
jgi:hypothetical protein